MPLKKLSGVALSRFRASIAPMQAPDPVTPEYMRELIEGAGMTQGEAARLLRMSPRAVRFWLAGDRAIPWAMAECLRAYLARKPPNLG